MKNLTLLIVFTLSSVFLYARPQYSILQTYGTKCSNCHINNNYGGQRNVGGYIARNSISVINPEDIGLKGLYDFLDGKNSFLDDKILWGLDFRLQNAKWGQTQKLQATLDSNLKPVNPPSPERKTMVMQLMPYLSVTPVSWLRVDAMYNFSYDIEPNMRYPGQQPGHISATFDIADYLPTIRIGYFPPDMGMDYDDHTLLVRQVAGPSRSNPLIPADYAELGIQLNYDRLSWLSASLGVFESKNMAALKINNTPIVNDNTLSTAMNLTFNSELPLGMIGYLGFTHFLNSQLKTDNSIYFQSGYYTISSAFLGIGLSDKVALLAEYATSTKQSIRKVDNFLIELNYQIYEPINVFARYEDATTDLLYSDQTFKANQYVFGAHIFLLPYIDLLPEFRIYDRAEINNPDNPYTSQFAVQLHIFY